MKSSNSRNFMVIDVGGTNVKVLADGTPEVVKIPSGMKMTPTTMVEEIKKVFPNGKFNGVAIGYPGPVVHGKPALEPHNLAPGWVAFDYKKAFGCPVKITNDAAMQALGGYEGGRMLFLGLGTGLGSALIVDGTLASLELAHLPYMKHRTFEDYVGLRGLEWLGKKKWREHVLDVVDKLKNALVADYVILGGGNARLLHELPRGVKLGDNSHAFRGGRRLLEQPDPEPQEGAS
jgi:predicted NBD/HSP70 family sugar kinase